MAVHLLKDAIDNLARYDTGLAMELGDKSCEAFLKSCLDYCTGFLHWRFVLRRMPFDQQLTLVSA